MREKRKKGWTSRWSRAEGTFRRPEAADYHCQSAGAKAGNSHTGRQYERAGYHRRSTEKALRELPDDMTVFIVSQRASSMMHADRILVLDDGRLVGSGSHAELLWLFRIPGNFPRVSLGRERSADG